MTPEARYLFRVVLSLAVTAFSWVGWDTGSAGLWVTVTWNVLQARVTNPCVHGAGRSHLIHTSTWAPPGAHRCVQLSLSMENSDIEIDGFCACRCFPPEPGFTPLELCNEAADTAGSFPMSKVCTAARCQMQHQTSLASWVASPFGASCPGSTSCSPLNNSGPLGNSLNLPILTF